MGLTNFGYCLRLALMITLDKSRAPFPGHMVLVNVRYII